MSQLSLLDYVPAQRHSETSVAAAERIEPVISDLEQQVLDFLADHGPATDQEMQGGIPMKESTQRPRRVKLIEKGRIIEAGYTRQTRSGRAATVWRLA